MIANDNFRYTALCVNCSLFYVTHVKRWVATTLKKDKKPTKVQRWKKALLGTSLIRSHAGAKTKYVLVSTLFCGSKMLNMAFITSTTLGELGFRNRKSTRDNPMVAHCYHSKTSWRCFLNLKRKENKAYGCDKKIKKKQLKLKKIIRRKTNWAKIFKIIINDLFEQKMNK